MCGIFGLIAGKKSSLTPDSVKSINDNLFKLSESRGKEASGIAVSSGNYIKVLKQSLPASKLIKTDDYHKLLSGISSPFTIISHARLVTNGAMAFNDNNQPVVKDGIVMIHNGIIVNDKELWGKYSDLKRLYEVDTEVMASLIHKFLKEKEELCRAVKKTFSLIEGSASIAVLFNNLDCLLLATNNGSLYAGKNKNGSLILFASEKYILDNLKQNLKIFQIKPNTAYIINTTSLSVTKFSLTDGNHIQPKKTTKMPKTRHIIDISPIKEAGIKITDPKGYQQITHSLLKDFCKLEKKIAPLRRCTKCILPETMPFIEFDERGVCNYCRNYRKIEILGEDALIKSVDKFRRKNGQYDCIVAFSGGRDSSYGLHYVKKILGMNPVAYSYDWGMLTDLGRRNQARMCGKLGVEHILISADIRQKREYIRKNVLAWLKKPDLGMIPLFMAGDKQYFYYANKLRKTMGIKLIIYTENLLEKTNFKFGFCGVKPQIANDHLYALPFFSKLKLAFYYLGRYITNSSYFNSSLYDSLGAYFSSYLMAHDYLYLYRYIKWDEGRISSILTKKYHWERANDTSTTWRIGDGTAAFYNYIYYCVAGFTENDTFRSNQIREGVLNRNEALKNVRAENKPRPDSIRWYCETIGIDFEETIKKINAIPKIYEK